MNTTRGEVAPICRNTNLGSTSTLEEDYGLGTVQESQNKNTVSDADRWLWVARVATNARLNDLSTLFGTRLLKKENASKNFKGLL